MKNTIHPDSTYIGDGVYVHYDGYHFVLQTTDGIRTTNRICLELDVYLSFARFVERTLDQKVGVKRE